MLTPPPPPPKDRIQELDISKLKQEGKTTKKTQVM